MTGNFNLRTLATELLQIGLGDYSDMTVTFAVCGEMMAAGGGWYSTLNAEPASSKRPIISFH